MMADISTLFNQNKIGDRQVSELVGIAHGIIADGRIDEKEAKYLQNGLWLIRQLLRIRS